VAVLAAANLVSVNLSIARLEDKHLYVPTRFQKIQRVLSTNESVVPYPYWFHSIDDRHNPWDEVNGDKPLTHQQRTTKEHPNDSYDEFGGRGTRGAHMISYVLV
jgi:hypothetical protein